MEYSEENESKIIQDVLDGDKAKYRLLVDRYSRMVFYVVRRYVNDDDDVEELAQQIFVKTYNRLDSFKENARFSSWLYSLASNHCRDYVKNIRRKNVRFSEMEEHDLSSRMSSEETPDEEIQRVEKRAQLEDALDQISSENAEAFLMKYRDDMTYKAMSKRLDVSVSALKVRVHRARKELKKYLESKNQ